MNTDIWRRVEEILDRALELPEEERAALVEEATRGHPDLRAEVDRMLEACSASEGMLSTPPPIVARDVLAFPTEPLQELAPGTVVGQYTIVEHLGRGGMGSVFLAERSDGTFEKQVALKVVQKTVASTDTLRRFEEERRILARLDHPNITGILDGGITGDGLPYFVMDLARGDAIDVHCDRLRLGVRERVGLFRTVCEAVQYAHGSLIVHRDLKPSNILVDSTGAVQLLDFGIAKALDERGDAAEPETVGPTQRLTPEYAAPEQVTGEPTTATTDVYALGAVLYELLVGERPYEIEDRSIAGIARAVCLEEPPAPAARVRDAGKTSERAAELRSTTVAGLANALDGDLDAIVLKALEKSPTHRYGSAAEFAADLRRYLEGRPVHARPQTRWYRTGKFLRRYRMQVSATGVALGLLGGGIVATTLQWRTAVRERGLREQEAVRAGLASSFLIETLQDLAPEQLGKPTLEPREVILLGMENLDDLEATPKLRAGVMNTLGRVSLSLSEYDLADSLFSGALAILEAEGESDTSLERAESMSGMGYRLLRGTGDSELSIPWFADALALRRQDLPPGDSLLVRSLTDLGFAMYGADQYREASDVLREALDLGAPAPLRTRTLDFLTNTLTRVATDLADAGDADAAADTLMRAQAVGQEALELGEQEFGPDDPIVADVLLSLTQVALLRGENARANQYARRSLRINLSVFGPRSSRTAISHAWLAQVQETMGDLEAAEESYEQALAVFTQVAPPWAKRPRIGLARVLFHQGRLDDAEPILLTSLPGTVEEETALEDEIEVLSLLVQLYEAREQLPRAREFQRRLDALGRTP